jgi:RAC serine/threonine-protein kinase
LEAQQWSHHEQWVKEGWVQKSREYTKKKKNLEATIFAFEDKWLIHRYKEKPQDVDLPYPLNNFQVTK